MHPYNNALKQPARHLRTTMTDTEQQLWVRLRRKNLLGVQFYRQKPLGNYIVDFYAPRAGLIVEIDGAQHLEEAHAARDAQRDAYLVGQGLQVLRFHTTQILQELDAVVEVIFRMLEERLAAGGKQPEIPPFPPLQKGGMGRQEEKSWNNHNN
jgi:very-short-patch-repair endonuclease